MILQTANIVSGIVLGAPKLKEWIGEQHIAKVEAVLTKHRETIGLIMLILGIVGLLSRMSIFDFYIYELGASYPQALPAIAMGLLLYSRKLERFAILRHIITFLRPYEVWIGLVGIAVGIGSIFFGCPLCTYY